MLNMRLGLPNVVLATLPQTIIPSGTFVVIGNKHDHSIVQKAVIPQTNVCGKYIAVDCKLIVMVKVF